MSLGNYPSNNLPLRQLASEDRRFAQIASEIPEDILWVDTLTMDEDDYMDIVTQTPIDTVFLHRMFWRQVANGDSIEMDSEYTPGVYCQHPSYSERFVQENILWMDKTFAPRWRFVKSVEPDKWPRSETIPARMTVVEMLTDLLTDDKRSNITKLHLSALELTDADSNDIINYICTPDNPLPNLEIVSLAYNYLTNPTPIYRLIDHAGIKYVSVVGNRLPTNTIESMSVTQSKKLIIIPNMLLTFKSMEKAVPAKYVDTMISSHREYYNY